MREHKGRAMTRKMINLRVPRPGALVLAGVLGLAGLHWLTGCAPVADPDPVPVNGGEVIKGPDGKAAAVPDSLKERVKAALDQVRNRDLLTTHSFWTVFHAILGNGLDAKIRNTFTNQEFKAVDYIRNGGSISGLEFLVYENIADGKDGVDVKIGPTFYGQGHQD